MANPCTKPVPAPCAPSTSDPRVLDAFTRRFNAATRQADLPPAPHPTNGDENLPDHIATYTKAIKQDGKGIVNPAAFATFAAAIASGSFAAFEAVQTGGARTLNGPMGSFAYTFCGADNSQFGAPVVPAPPALASPEYAVELVELYWCSLLRDVAFSDYATNPTAQAASAELTTLHHHYKGPQDHHTVTPALLFRGAFAGETIGPYISQFLVTPTNFGAQPFSQQYLTYLPNIDFLTDETTWEQVQNGTPTGKADQPDPQPRFLHDGRGLAAWTHVDELYQAYFTAYLVMNNTLKVPFNPGNPYAHSRTQNGFGTFGGPDIAAVLGAVAKVALNAVWYQKWVVHLRHRPESGAGLVHYLKQGVTYSASPDPIVLNSQAAAASFARYGAWFLSQPFPEGSPAHPAYPTGHGAVGGACITILKFFFDGNFVLANPKAPSSDGLNLAPWNQDPATGARGPLTVNGELHKLAHNITFGHGLHGGIHWRSDSDASMELGEAVAISFLEDLVCTYAEPFNITITKLNGHHHTFHNA